MIRFMYLKITGLVVFILASSWSQTNAAVQSIGFFGGYSYGFYTTGDLVGSVYNLGASHQVYSRLSCEVSSYFFHWKMMDPEEIVMGKRGYDLMMYGLNLQANFDALKFATKNTTGSLGVGLGVGYSKMYRELEFFGSHSPDPEPELLEYIKSILDPRDKVYDFGKIGDRYHIIATVVDREWVSNWLLSVYYKIKFERFIVGTELGLKKFIDKGLLINDDPMLWFAGLKIGYLLF